MDNSWDRMVDLLYIKYGKLLLQDNHHSYSSSKYQSQEQNSIDLGQIPNLATSFGVPFHISQIGGGE